MSTGWQNGRHHSVIGAAHRRRGKPCQDASLARRLLAPDGQPLLLLAVADGHGGSRYERSAVGSQLACEQALVAVGDALQRCPLTDLEAWRGQLRGALPAAIQRRWLAAIEADWQQNPRDPEQPFSPLSYGTTLGLVLLAPGWWGCTGLGDWDLVLVNGQWGTLVSQEPDQPGGGEATASLCMVDAQGSWSSRALLRPMTASDGPCSLLLSTDGLRKSCASDADFLLLCPQVLALQDPTELADGLRQISAAGSGDDVSVAMGDWASPQRRSPRRPRALPIALAVASAAALLLGLSLAARGPRPAAPPDPIRAEAQRLCRSPALIPGSLAQRKAVLDRLRREPGFAAQLRAKAAADPLSALLVSPLQPPPCPALQLALQRQWQHQGEAGGRP